MFNMNLGIVSYAAYKASFNTPVQNVFYTILVILALLLVLSMYLKDCRYDRIVKKEHHSEAFFEAHEQYRHHELGNDLKQIF